MTGVDRQDHRGDIFVEHIRPHHHVLVLPSILFGTEHQAEFVVEEVHL